MKEKKFTLEHDQSSQHEFYNKGMDRRSFIGKTTKMAGVALGATLVGSFNELPVRRCFTFIGIVIKWK